MRRDAHPPHTRPHFLIAPRPAAALCLLALALTLATGALQSPFLLLLPAPALMLLLGIARNDARWAVAFGTLVLLAGHVAHAGFDVVAMTAGIVGALVLYGFGERLRSRLASGPAAVPLQQDPASRQGSAHSTSRELESLLERTRVWTGAVAVTLWQCREGVALATAAAGRALPVSLRLEGDALGWVAREGTPIWIEPTPSWSEPGRSVAASLLRTDPQATWLITTEYAAEQGRPAHEDLDAAHGALRLFIEVLAAQEQAATGQERLERLLVLLRRIPVEIEAAAFGRELLAAAIPLAAATGGTLASWDDSTGQVIITAGDDGGPIPGARFTAPTSELALAARAGGLIERTDGRWRAGATHVASESDQWLRRPLALAALPLASPSGIVGLLGLWTSRARRLDTDGLILLQTVLPYAALHMAHASEFGRLREHADHDPLTGLRNRRGFETAFLNERIRCERYDHPLALLILDIDHFKRINDEHGHDAGDEVLRAVAAVLRNATRDVDVTARHGGEEFVVLLPETGLAAARDAAERVRTAVATATVDPGGRQLSVTVSVGVSAWPDSATAPADLLPGADAALYEAKRSGRNRVVAARPHETAAVPAPSATLRRR